MNRIYSNQKRISENSILLINPKYAINVGNVIRSASCFGFKNVVFTGNRVLMDIEQQNRLPREERMKGYAEVDLINTDYPFDMFDNLIPVAVELKENAISLPEFEHPTNAVYVFGPEDGGLKSEQYKFCHHFVYIPSRHCFNLASAVNIVLYDRMVKMKSMGISEFPQLDEHRGFIEPQLFDYKRK